MRITNVSRLFHSTVVLITSVVGFGVLVEVGSAGEPVQGTAKQIDLGCDVVREIVYIPPGEFKMGSTPAEKKWAVGEEGGAKFSSGGGQREAYEGEFRSMRVQKGFWMGRTEVTVGQFRRFADLTGYVSDAEKPGGQSQCFNPKWTPKTKMGGAAESLGSDE